MIIPTLQSTRLILRGHTPADFEDYAAIRADPDVMHHMGDGSPITEEESWASFLKGAGMWQMTGFGSWAIEEKTSGKLIGSAGFQDRKRDRGPELRGVPEAGWLLARSAWGNGYACEALSAALLWAKAHFGPVRVIALITDENIASIRVAEKCGFREVGPIISAGRERLLFDRAL